MQVTVQKSPTRKCLIAFTHYQQTPQEGNGNPDSIDCPKFPSTPAVWRGPDLPNQGEHFQGEAGRGEGRAGPPGAAQRPSPLVLHPLPPGEKCSHKNPHSCRPHCARLLSGVAGAWLTAAASGSGLGSALTEQRQRTGEQPRGTHWARLSPQPVLGVPPGAGTGLKWAPERPFPGNVLGATQRMQAGLGSVTAPVPRCSHLFTRDHANPQPSGPTRGHT